MASDEGGFGLHLKLHTCSRRKTISDRSSMSIYQYS